MRDAWDVALNKQTKLQRVRPPYVSLNRRGEIVMNDKAFKAILCPYNVALLYDSERRTIAVKCPVWQDMHFFRVRRYGRGRRMRIVRAGRMLKQFGLTIERTLVFRNVRVEWFDRPVARHRRRDREPEPMLILELDNATAIERRRHIHENKTEMCNCHRSAGVGQDDSRA